MTEQARKQIGIWLLIGVFMVFMQIVIGGITRLTGSGLSITEWQVVMGTIPPLSAEKWDAEFQKYRQSPQYQLLNKGMSLQEFKSIYWWEYIHRLWARLMGFVFAIPFFIFLFQKKIKSRLLLQLGMVILMASVVASFGWLMVKSGLEEKPWVSPYKLTLHLSLALALYAYLLWLTCLLLFKSESGNPQSPMIKRWSNILLIFISLQLVIGGLMSGMRAGLFYPTFPLMNGEWIPSALLFPSNWSLEAFTHYDTQPFAVAFVQFTHRLLAYLIMLVSFVFFFKSIRHSFSPLLKSALYALVAFVAMQFTLGVLTVINSKGAVPVTLGVLHQAGAVLLLSTVLFIRFRVSEAGKE